MARSRKRWTVGTWLGTAALGLALVAAVGCETDPLDGRGDAAGGADAGGSSGGGGVSLPPVEDAAPSKDLAAGPQLVVVPERGLEFRDVPLGASATQTVTLQNVGDGPAEVARVVANGDPAFTVVVSGVALTAGAAPGRDVGLVPPIEVPIGGTLELPVTFTRTSVAAADGTVSLQGDGPGAPLAIVTMYARQLDELLATPASVDFGIVAVGTTADRTLQALWNGEDAVTVTNVAIVDASNAGAFQLDAPDPAAPFVLRPNEATSLVLRYTPAACPTPAEPDAATLRLRYTHGSERTLRVPLAARCSDGGDPPEPAIVVAEGARVIPQTTLHLSYAGPETPLRYEWQVEGPKGSMASFGPSATSASPTFTANVAGTYVFHLDVGTEEEPVAHSLRYEVEVVPESAIHVELLWTTPDDPDETDGGPSAGADVDLHFVHPDAPADSDAADRDLDGAPDPWFDEPLDCFWYNPHPDWGALGDPGDDPRLDLDDTDGAGPENVNLDVPEDGARYGIAAHYWNDNGFGASFVTARVYIEGALAWEVDNIRLLGGELWCIAFVEWPSGAVVPCEEPGEGYRITHDYPSPLAQQP